MSKINIGIAGCGWISNHAHLYAISDIEQFRVISIYDNNEYSLINTSDKWNISGRYSVYDNFLNSNIKAVVLATPNYTHKNFIIEAVKQGKWVLCEKPIVINENEIQEISSEVGEKSKYIIPAFVNRFRMDIDIFKEEMKSIGAIKRIEAKWIRKNGIPRPGTWFTNQNLAGGGVLMDLGPHVLDICLYIIRSIHSANSESIEVINSKIEYLNTNKTNEAKAGWFHQNDNNLYNIDVESKIKATVMAGDIAIDLELCWESEESNDYTQFVVYGTRGSVKLDTLFGFSNCRKFDNTKIVAKKDHMNITKNIFLDKNIQIQAFKNMHLYFLKCIKKGEAGELNIQEAKRIVTIIDKIYKSAGVVR